VVAKFYYLMPNFIIFIKIITVVIDTIIIDNIIANIIIANINFKYWVEGWVEFNITFS